MTDRTTSSLPTDLQARKDEAEVARAEAEAARAAADARSAAATARKGELEVADHDGPLAQQRRDAKVRKEIAEAEKDAAVARQEQLSKLIPDLSQVKDSTLEVKEGPPLYGTPLTFGALRTIGTSIAEKLLTDTSPTSWRVLVTSDPDLASSHAIHMDVMTGLKQLEAAAQRLLEKPEEVETATAAGADIAALLAGAVPQVLSLLSAQRTLSTAVVSVNDIAAAAAVAGALKANPNGAGLAVIHDDFRLVPGGVYDTAKRVSTKRQELIGNKLMLGERKSQLDSELTTAKAEEKTLEKALADAGKNPPPDLPRILENVRKQIVGLTREATNVALRLGLIDSLITSIDTFSAAIRVVPEGAHRSTLATAALYELLHEPGSAADSAKRFSHVLLVKGQPGQSQQLLENRPFWFRDHFSTVVDISITYMLIETSTSHLVASGTVTATAKAYGKIGEEPTVRLDQPK